jgi:hypothetical protein
MCSLKYGPAKSVILSVVLYRCETLSLILMKNVEAVSE